jgi:hypothetical protein
MKTSSLAALVVALGCGGALAQAPHGDTDTGTGANGTGHSGDASMPAEIVPPTATDTPTMGSVGGSGTASDSAAAPAVATGTPSYQMPTRAEVRAETAPLVRSGLIPHGELSSAFQDKGGQVGATPF